MDESLIEKQNGNFAKPVLCAVHIGTVIEVENTLFKVVKKYNDYVWKLKADTGEIINVFYALSQRWSLHCILTVLGFAMVGFQGTNFQPTTNVN